MEDIENIRKLCDLIGDKKFLYISGNGGAGKTTYAQKIKNFLEMEGKVVNLISTDDFITDSKVRNNSKCEWLLNGKSYEGRYTSCCEESYFWNGLVSVLYSLSVGCDICLKTKRNGMIRLHSGADLTIVEGIGTCFMSFDEQSVSLWFECEKETEIERRMKRGGLSREEVVSRIETRDSQFLANVLPKKFKFDYVIETNNESLKIIKNMGEKFVRKNHN